MIDPCVKCEAIMRQKGSEILHFVQDDRPMVQDDRPMVQDDRPMVQDDRLMCQV